MEYLKEIEVQFRQIEGKLREDLMGIRTNRPAPQLIDNIRVNYLEQSIPIKQLGSINIEMPRDLIVNIWDQNAVANVANAIEAANLGVSVSTQGNSVRVTLPDLTEERKQELIKVVKSIGEDGRIRMRQDRNEATKMIKELKDEDERFRAKEELQKLVDTFNQKIDDLIDGKSKDILG